MCLIKQMGKKIEPPSPLRIKTKWLIQGPRGVLPYQEVGGGGRRGPRILPLKFLLEHQILPPKI